VPSVPKPKLLVVELWGIGDLAIATPFLRAASEHFDVTLMANPAALELQPRFWPQVRVETFVAPWTAFQRKYHFWRWPWKEMLALRRRLRAKKFETGLSTRWDPRDHWLLKFFGVKTRIGFSRLGSGIFLTDSLTRPGPTTHRYESWRVAGKFLGIELPARRQITFPSRHSRKRVLVHSGAGQPVRVWPLENYRTLVRRLRENGYPVQVVCDTNQRDWWLQFDEPHVATPKTVTELIAMMDQAGVFVGNDSGPGHLAAISGVPTFTIFGPQLPEYFVPLHPRAGWIEGMACSCKPCKDYCRFPTPHCLWNITGETAWPRVKSFVQSHLGGNF